MTFNPWGEKENLERAIRFGSRMHDGQVDKLGQPYILHPLAVMLAVHDCGGDFELQVAAVLHDVAEDCFDTVAEGVEEISALFGPTVARHVEALSKRNGESYDDFITRVIHTSPGTALIKACDIDSNLKPKRLLRLDEDTRNRLLGKYLPARERLADYLAPLPNFNLER